MTRQQTLATAILITVLIALFVVFAAPGLLAPYFRAGASGRAPGFEVGAPSPGDRRVVLSKLGTYCGSCRQAIAAALSGVDGVSGFSIDIQRDEALVSYNAKRTRPEAIKQAIISAGYKVGGVRRL